MKRYPILHLRSTSEPADDRDDREPMMPGIEDVKEPQKPRRQMGRFDQRPVTPEQVRQRKAQRDRLTPSFLRLAALLRHPTEVTIASQRRDVTSFLPNRAIVFESPLPSYEFGCVLKDVSNLEWIAIERTPRPVTLLDDVDDAVPEQNDADQDSIVKVDHEDKEHSVDPVMDRTRLIAMPKLKSLHKLIRCWKAWIEYLDEEGYDSSRLHNIFDILNVRLWSPLDRVADLRADLEEIYENSGTGRATIRLEAELWYRKGTKARKRGMRELLDRVREIGGVIVERILLKGTQHHFALIEIPLRALEELVSDKGTPLAKCDSVRYFRQEQFIELASCSPLNDTWQQDSFHFSQGQPPRPGVTSSSTQCQVAGRPLPPDFNGEPNQGSPIAVLFDGNPDGDHHALRGRLVYLNPSDKRWNSSAWYRTHATGMASLLLHGDLHHRDYVVCRPIAVCPIDVTKSGAILNKGPSIVMIAQSIEKSIALIKSCSSDARPIAPEVFLANLSFGAGAIDPKLRPSNRSLAFHIDVHSYKHQILFVNSAGNCPKRLRVFRPAGTPDTVTINGDRCWPCGNEVIHSLIQEVSQRRITSPGDSRNAIVVGSQYSERRPGRRYKAFVKPYCSSGYVPNIYSCLGLGQGDAVKPDLLIPSGKHPVAADFCRDSVVLTPPDCDVAGPVVARPGRNYRKHRLQSGTSPAAAQVTNAAQRIYETLELDSEDMLEKPPWLQPEYRAVTMKALLVHSTTWGNRSCFQNGLMPSGGGSSQRLPSNYKLTQVLGYGFPNFKQVMQGMPNRVTVMDCHSMHDCDTLHKYTIVLPKIANEIEDPFELVVTVAWFSPVDNLDRVNYVRLGAVTSLNQGQFMTLKRNTFQPPKELAENGTVNHQRFILKATAPLLSSGLPGITENIEIRIRRIRRPRLDKDTVPFALVATLQGPEEMPLHDEVIRFTATTLDP